LPSKRGELSKDRRFLLARFDCLRPRSPLFLSGRGREL
jgi:hypothetical protein